MKRLISAIFTLCILTGIGNAQRSNAPAPFIVIQVTDTQFGMYEADKGFSKETELYEKAVDAINKLNPDFVVLTGDLVNKKDDRDQVAEFKRITAKIKKEIPVYYSPGNHDIGQPTTQKDIDTFVSDYGHDRFSFKHKKSLIIGMNSCLIKSNTPVLEEAQFGWLRKELSKGKKTKNIILFTHYPFFINSFDEADAYFNISVETRKRYLTLFKEYGVDAVFAGHLHNNGSGKYGDMQMITTSAVGKPLGEVQSGFRVIKVYPHRVENVYYTLNEIPEIH